MYVEHEDFQEPDDENVNIWRYLGLAKLLSLIHSRSLFLCRADQLGDPFEGSTPELHHKRVVDELLAGGLTTSNVEQIEATMKELRHQAFVNCWHVNEHESDAMWIKYAQSGYGVAIRSTFKQLAASLAKCEFPVHIGMVSYMDYATAMPALGPRANVFRAFLLKRVSFQHERELRVITLSFDRSIGDGLLAPVDLPTLIQEIRIAPTAPPWYREVVSSTLAALEFECPIEQSALAANPYFGPL